MMPYFESWLWKDLHFDFSSLHGPAKEKCTMQHNVDAVVIKATIPTRSLHVLLACRFLCSLKLCKNDEPGFADFTSTQATQTHFGDGAAFPLDNARTGICQGAVRTWSH